MVKCFVEPEHLGFILAHLQDSRDPIHLSELKQRHLITDETYYQTILDALGKLPHKLQVRAKSEHISFCLDVPISSNKPSNINNNITASASSIDTATTGAVCVDLAASHLSPRVALWVTIHDDSIGDDLSPGRHWGRTRSCLIPAKVKWCFLDSPGLLDPPWEENPWEPKGSHGRGPLGPSHWEPSISLGRRFWLTLRGGQDFR